jgi:hypothetical protein
MPPNDRELPLIDWLYAMTFGKPVPQWQSNKRTRQALRTRAALSLMMQCRAFLADLSNAGLNKRSHTLNLTAADQMRSMARLPHSSVWAEYDFNIYNAIGASRFIRSATTILKVWRRRCAASDAAASASLFTSTCAAMQQSASSRMTTAWCIERGVRRTEGT